MIHKLQPKLYDNGKSKASPFPTSFLLSLPWAQTLRTIPGLLLIVLVPWSLFAPLLFPSIFAAYFLLLCFLFFANNIRSAYGVYTAYHSAKYSSSTDWLLQYTKETGTKNGSDLRHDLPFNSVQHIIIIPNYKETLDTLCETLDVLASHSAALTQYRICLAMEESEEKCSIKAQNLTKLYSDFFYEVCYTIHPKGRPGEIRGKSSNVAWAASQMALRCVNGLEGLHDHEILTIIDADTCFAEDYFKSISYHYTTALPEQRKIMMFAPCTVFDRNADEVPVFVRVTDMFWSIGVMSNLYPSSSIKLPCSAYSISMDLALSVNFWDTGNESIGEDMHMYLKCFFATEGRVIVKSIFSPASQCNVEGEGFGISGWFGGISARYTQAKRHLWGSLDTSYAVRKFIYSYLAPGSETVVKLKNSKVDKFGKEENCNKLQFSMIVALMHRLLEAHILMGHMFLIIILTSLILPLRTSYPLSYIYGTLANEPLPWLSQLTLDMGFWARTLCVIPNIVMIYYYEKYHKWVSVTRWKLQKPHPLNGMGNRVDSAIEINISEGDLNDFSGQVQYLGKRSQLLCTRKESTSILDWFVIPVAGLFFYITPQIHAQISHIWTDSLEYKVAAKPQLVRPSSTYIESIPLMDSESHLSCPLDIKVHNLEEKSVTSSGKGDEGFFEEFESDTSSYLQEHVDKDIRKSVFSI